MTIPNDNNRNDYIGSGTTGPFAFNFKIFAESDITVIKRRTSSGAETTLTLTTDYTVDGVDEESGTVTLTSALSSDYTLHLIRTPSFTQDAVFGTQRQQNARTWENTFDYSRMVDIRLMGLVDAAIKLPNSEDPADYDLTLGGSAERANTFPHFDAAGNLEHVSDVTTVPAGVIPQIVDTFAALRAITTTPSYTTYFVRGKSSAGDGAGGLFYWNATDTSSDNGGTILTPNGGGTGRWNRLYNGAVDVCWFGAVGDDATDNSTALQAALTTGKAVYIPQGTYRYATGVTLSADGQKLVGDGIVSVLRYTGNGTAISANSKQNTTYRDFKLIAASAAKGISIPILSHKFTIDNIVMVGNSSAITASSEGISVATAFYGHILGCDISYFAIGTRFTAEGNGNTASGCYWRQNTTGVQIDGSGGFSNGNTIEGGDIESAGTSDTGIKVHGAGSNVFQGVRMELTGISALHVSLQSLGGTVSQYNQFLGICMEGTAAAYTLGTGSGSNQVTHTTILGGRCAGAIVIKSDCLYTFIQAAPSSLLAALTDDGYGSVINVDATTAAKNYARTASSNSTAGYDRSIGGFTTIYNWGGNAVRYDYTNLSSAFSFKNINAGGTQMAVMLFGAYRFWISPTNGKAYINGTDPTAHDDGTVVGTQT